MSELEPVPPKPTEYDLRRMNQEAISAARKTLKESGAYLVNVEASAAGFKGVVVSKDMERVVDVTFASEVLADRVKEAVAAVVDVPEAEASDRKA